MSGKLQNHPKTAPRIPTTPAERIDEISRLQQALRMTLPRVGLNVKFGDQMHQLATELYQMGVRIG